MKVITITCIKINDSKEIQFKGETIIVNDNKFQFEMLDDRKLTDYIDLNEVKVIQIET